MGEEAVFDFGNVTEVTVGGFDDGVNMRSRKGRVQDDAKVVCKGRMDDYGGDGQRDGSIFIQGGSGANEEEFSV